MNIILVSNTLAKTRSITISGPQLGFAAVALALLIISLSVLLQYASLRYALLNDSPYLRSLIANLQAQENQRAQHYLRESLNAMAGKLGEMQAQLTRLDALGDRLSRIAGFKQQEFMFDRLPARGGAESTVAPREFSMDGLNRELERLAKDVDDRSDKLGILESALTLDHAKRQLLPTAMPVATGYFSSSFGWRIDPFTGMSAFHEGTDFMAQEGTPILAAAGGMVVFAGSHPQYGNMVEIDHGNDIISRYAHASRLLVRIGDVVLRGSKIAEVGNTGRSTGTHLHFEVRLRGAPQNPARFLRMPG